MLMIAAAVLLQERHGRLGRAHRGHEIDVDAGEPAALVVLHAEARGVVDQDIDAAQRFGSLVDVARNGCTIAQVASHAEHLTAVALQLRLGRLHAFGAARADRHVRTVCGEGKRDRTTDAAAAARHHRLLAFE